MTGIQAEGAAPLVKLFKGNSKDFQPVDEPETIATAIKIGNPVSWKKAISAVRESKGLMEAVSDKEILEAQKYLSRKEGIFVEPGSASSIAGLLKLDAQGTIDHDETVVCITTGNGLKDPNVIVDSCKDAIIEVESINQILKHLAEV